MPGTTFRESLLGQALDELSHVENLPQRLPIVAAAGADRAAALGLGELALRGLRLRDGLRPAERLALDFGLGPPGWACSRSLVGRAGLLEPLAVPGRAGRDRRWPGWESPGSGRRAGPSSMPTLSCSRCS